MTSNDRFRFHRSFYSVPDKISQDNFIIKYVEVTSVKRRRPRNNSRENGRQFSVKYTIFSRRLKLKIPICKKAFIEILCIKAARLEGVVKRFGESGEMPQERRGGDRKTPNFASRKEAVENFVKRFKPLESHYCRSLIKQRLYLASELNIKKMWRMYSDQALAGYDVKHGYFRKVFNRSFNIGFGSPRQDVCSNCLQLTERMKVAINEREKQELRTQLRIHKLRAKCYFQYLRDDDPDVQIISFDCQKNLPLPKIPDQSVYYSRQLYLYNLTVVIGSSKTSLTSDNVHAYVWTEDQAAKGANEICTCVYHCLNSINLEGKKKLRMVADGCGGQNKNAMILTMAMKWLYDSKVIYPDLQEVQLIFPVTGHSFIPPDRVFALTEKEIKRRECIVEPQEYMDVIKLHATVHKVGVDFPVLDWKSQRQENIKSALHFQISKCKRIILTRSQTNKILIRGETSYRNDSDESASILKRGKRIENIIPSEVETGNAVKAEKLEDVGKLLEKHYGAEWQTLPHLSYYKNVIRNVIRNEHNDQDEDEIANNSESYAMEEVLDFV